MKQISITAGEIAALVKGKCLGDPQRVVDSVAGIRHAQANQLSFVGAKRYMHQLENTQAGVIIICPDLADADATNRSLIVCDNVDLAFATAVAVFAEEPPQWQEGIHPRAVVDPTAKIGQHVSIGPCAVIEAEAEIGDGAKIGAGCYIGHRAKVGANSMLYPNVTVMYRCVVGRQCVIHPGVVLGADGFGFIPSPKGLVKVPQTGIVQIDDDVEIGANTTIDRARFGKTWIKSNAKIDDQVMVAHNVAVGESSILVAQSGIAGSAELGRGVILAGKAGINGHTVIGDGAQIAGFSSVVKDLAPGAILLGSPGEPQRDFMNRLSLPKKVAKLKDQLKALEARLAELEK